MPGSPPVRRRDFAPVSLSVAVAPFTDPFADSFVDVAFVAVAVLAPDEAS
jgi:hypothetical protein